MSDHDWRILLQYRVTDEEARKLVEGYGHPEVDNAPDRWLASGEAPPVGDPRVFLGTHNLLRDQTVVVCWKCEQGWDPELAEKRCLGESALPENLGNVSAPMGPVGRNDPCPCGSGLKFKHCHGR